MIYPISSIIPNLKNLGTHSAQEILELEIGQEFEKITLLHQPRNTKDSRFRWSKHGLDHPFTPTLKKIVRWCQESISKSELERTLLLPVDPTQMSLLLMQMKCKIMGDSLLLQTSSNTNQNGQIIVALLLRVSKQLIPI